MYADTNRGSTFPIPVAPAIRSSRPRDCAPALVLVRFFTLAALYPSISAWSRAGSNFDLVSAGSDDTGIVVGPAAAAAAAGGAPAPAAGAPAVCAIAAAAIV